jgi:hypothetical protein
VVAAGASWIAGGQASGVWGGSCAASGGARRRARLSRARTRGVTVFRRICAHRVNGHAGAGLFPTASLGTEDAQPDPARRPRPVFVCTGTPAATRSTGTPAATRSTGTPDKPRSTKAKRHCNAVKLAHAQGLSRTCPVVPLA